MTWGSSSRIIVLESARFSVWATKLNGEGGRKGSEKYEFEWKCQNVKRVRMLGMGREMSREEGAKVNEESERRREKGGNEKKSREEMRKLVDENNRKKKGSLRGGRRLPKKGGGRTEKKKRVSLWT